MPSGRASISLAVALVAAGMLLVEIAVTRLFSVLFFFHYSFVAVSMVMSGLALGGILAARFPVPAEAEDAARGRLGLLAFLFAAGLAAAIPVLVVVKPEDGWPSLSRVAVQSVCFVPALVAAGAFLATVFAGGASRIGWLYAADLLGAGLACIAIIPAMRIVQGPAVLLVPALLGGAAVLVLAPRSRWLRVGAVGLLLLLCGGIGANLATRGRFLRLPLPPPRFERWNEHSLVRVWLGQMIVIDRGAATPLVKVPVDPTLSLEKERARVAYMAYALGRPMERTAVIGVGGGRDVLAALAHGARHVDGYEVNRTILDLICRDMASESGLCENPRATLVHAEGRVGIARSGRRYDVIQASLIDTWAATASGAFVLSENGLYTVEAWRTFLGALTDRGVLTMTRFYVPDAPAEIYRLVSLAIDALSATGVADPAAHVALGIPVEMPKAGFAEATILVSRSPFDAQDRAALERVAADAGVRLLAKPGAPSPDPVIAGLLDPATRAATIAASPYDISPPTDLHPYFFLQLRPRQVLSATASGPVVNITFRAVKVLLLLAGLSGLFAAGVLALGFWAAPRADVGQGARRSYLWMCIYFFGIGVGYILIQLGMHQRLILVLGHPTLAFSVVLFSMLIGTGLGSAASARLFPDGTFLRAWVAILAVLAALPLTLPLVPRLDAMTSDAVRIGLVVAVMGSVGFVLGFGFPLGVRLVSPVGGWAVERMWAVNGAASIAGSVAAATLGMAVGSHAVLIAGLAAYVLVGVAGVMASGATAAVELPRR